MGLTKKRALWGATESGGYAVDPSADGSGYTALPIIELGELEDKKQPIEVQQYDGVNEPSPPVDGADGWSFRVTHPMIGLVTAAGDGVAPPAADWFDAELLHWFGSALTVNGEGLNAGSAASTMVLDTTLAGFDVGVLGPVFEANVPAALPRAQWVERIAGGTPPTYNISPNWESTPTTAAVLYGTRSYVRTDFGGLSRSFLYRDGSIGDYWLGGGRATSVEITEEINQVTKIAVTYEGDRKTKVTKASLPAAASSTAIGKIKGLASPLWFNGVKYGTRRVSVSLGIQASPIADLGALNGRSDFTNTGMEPMVTVEPLRTDAILELKRNLTPGLLLVQFGRGLLSGGVLNTCAFAASNARVVEAAPSDDSGRARQSVQIKCYRALTGRYAQFARA